MNRRLGNILYGASLVGAAISILYAVDTIWVHESGRSLLPISGRFVTRENMLATVGTGFVLAFLFWGAGTAARYFLNRSAEKHRAAK